MILATQEEVPFIRDHRNVELPRYDRSEMRTGIVHFGPGAFHRGHQASFIDDILNVDPNWGICEVSLHSRAVRDALKQQENLYVLGCMDERTRYRVIGAISEFLVAHEDPKMVIERLSAPTTKLVTLTITEKGYSLCSDGGLDLEDPALLSDLEALDQPRTAIGFIVAGLAQRHAKGHGPLTIMSCDNLERNGETLKEAVLEFARLAVPDVADWIETECCFPSTMVDSITPATTPSYIEQVKHDTGISDAWPIQREEFAQWVIEKKFAADLPPFLSPQVILAANVEPYEIMKLRLLNGAHSVLAYVGLACGFVTVAEALQHPVIETFVENTMREEIARTLSPPDGFQLGEYIASVIARFRNRSVDYRLSQIAWDGSKKIPIRLLGTIYDLLREQGAANRLVFAIACWVRHVESCWIRGQDQHDPLSDKLIEAVSHFSGDAFEDIARIVAIREIFPIALVRERHFIDTLTSAFQTIRHAPNDEIMALLSQLESAEAVRL